MKDCFANGGPYLAYGSTGKDKNAYIRDVLLPLAFSTPENKCGVSYHTHGTNNPLYRRVPMIQVSYGIEKRATGKTSLGYKINDKHGCDIMPQQRGCSVPTEQSKPGPLEVRVEVLGASSSDLIRLTWQCTAGKTPPVHVVHSERRRASTLFRARPTCMFAARRTQHQVYVVCARFVPHVQQFLLLFVLSSVLFCLFCLDDSYCLCCQYNICLFVLSFNGPYAIYIGRHDSITTGFPLSSLPFCSLAT